MRRNRVQEKRSYPRYALQCKIQGRELKPLQVTRFREKMIRGKVENIGAGGLCMRADRALKIMNPVRCELVLKELPVSIPLVMQVRWAKKMPRGKKYRIGLAFLI